MNSLRAFFREITRYPSATAGLLFIVALVVVSVITVITIPYGEVVRLWRGDEEMWAMSPRNAAPAWMNLFTRHKLPQTILLGTAKQPELKERINIDGLDMVNATLEFDFQYDAFPAEISLFYTSTAKTEPPFVTAYWETPDGRRIELESYSVNGTQRYYISLDQRLRRPLNNRPPEIGLFAALGSEPPVPLKGSYKLVLEGYLFEPDADIDATLVVYGKVHGWAGTDHRRRDLLIALLWGAPLALAFGLLAALGSTVCSFAIAAIGVWYGKWIDALIQRITEINMVLPFLPILIMVGTFYSHSIWTILTVAILLGIFGSSIKTYRAMFLQVKQAPYLEAAKAYGASNLRLVFRYMIPRMIPVLIPSFVTLIPTYVFLEASLAVLGLGDPVLPTWGKLLQDANTNGALFKGLYYWVLQPAALLMLTGLGFAMVGFALDRIYNPRLRGR